MSEKTQLSESHAIAKLTDSYDFDLNKKEHKEILKSLVKIAEKRVDAEPKITKMQQKHGQKMALIGVLAAVVTISFLIWVNHLNHTENVRLKELQYHAPAKA